MTALEALALGIVQGLTEFLPVSSSGHLVLSEHLLARLLNTSTPDHERMAFNVMCHLGTLGAVAAVFWRPFIKCLSSRKYAPMILGRAVAACAVTGVIGIWLKDDFEEMFNSLRSVAGGFLITGALLLFVERLPSGNRSWRQLTWVGALLIGLAQAAAITPGVSRSGSTICIALLVGLRRRWAAEFSFLIAAPIILGATVLELSEVGLSGISRDKAAMLAIGALTSGVVGYGALKLLLRMLRNSKLHLFSYYLWTLGLCILMFWE